jgi:CARDB protein
MPELGKVLLVFGLLFLGACSSNGSDDSDSCNPDDRDGVVGGNQTVLVSVSDTDFAVGGVNSGSTERNIAVQNSSTVTLTLTNVGTKPHDLHIACIPTGLPANCPATSCFPDHANIPALTPGDSTTVTFVTPAEEGAYQFTSDVDGDTSIDADGGVTGLVGELVLM